ncbi:MAG: MFS transporter [Gammaproteobacteria bacterium]
MGVDAQAGAGRRPYRWVMLAGVWLVYACFGLTVSSMAPLVQPIVEELGLSLAGMGSVMGAWPFVYLAAALPAGAFVDRVGLTRSLALATLLIALSAGLRTVAGGQLGLFLAVGVFGLGGPLVSAGAPKLISSWFGADERGTALGIYMTGPAVGTVAALSLTNSVMMPWLDGDWRAVLRCYAGVVVLCGVLWMVVTRHPAARAAEVARAARRPEPLLRVFLALLKASLVRRVLLLSVAIFWINHGLNNWLPEILRAGGMSAERAGFWASVPIVVGIAGALTIPRFAIRGRRIAVLGTMFVCAGLGVALLDSGVDLGLAIGLVAQGVAKSAMMPVAVLLLIESKAVGPHRAGTAGGLFFTVAEIGGVLGPLSLGYVADVTGGFSAALWMLGGLCALGLLVLRGLRE